MRPRSLFFPLLLVAAGVLLFLVNFGYVQGTTWSVLGTYWPAVLIIGGLDGLYRRDGWIGPLVLLGFGVVLLLGNLGYFAQNAWELLLRLWPIFLIGIGLDLAFGHGRSTWSVLAKVLVGLALVAAIFWFALASPFGTAYHPVNINQALNGATSSSMQYSIGAGEFDLQGGAGANTLVSGTVSLPESSQFAPHYNAPKNGQSSYMLEGPGVTIGANGSEQMTWNLAVTNAIPLTIKVDMGAGSMAIDLSQTQLETLDANLGVGTTTIELPSGRSLNGDINTAIGEVVLRIPSCAAVNISVDRGISELKLPAGYANVNGEVIYQAPQGCSGNVIDLHVSTAIGSLQIVKLP